MATGPLSAVLDHLRRATLPPEEGGMTDGQLLECFVTRRDEAAFEALVRRHGPMVLGVCRRVLACPQDVEDAFQATFLVLVRKATSIGQRELVGNWLYGTAYRAALEAKAARQRVRERQVSTMPEQVVIEEADVWFDLRPVLDQELDRLPERYRVAVVLCDLEGRTRQEVARQLGVPEGTVSGRLTTARRMLAKRLARRGLAISAGALATVLSQNVSAASVPAPLLAPTVQAAALLAAGETVGVVSARALALAEGVSKAMLLRKLVGTTVFLLALGVLAVGGGLLIGSPLTAPADDPPVAAEQTALAPQEARELVQERPKREKPKGGPTLAGQLLDVDTGKNTVTVSTFNRKDGAGEKTLPVAKGAKVQRDGKDAKLADLKKGSRARLTLSADQKSVVSIDVETPAISTGLKAVDADKNTFTIVTGPRGAKEDKVYKVAKDAKITIDGKDARLADLKAGTVVSFWVDDRDTVIRVRISTAVRPPRKPGE